MDNSSLSIGWLTIDSTPPVRSMEDNSDIGSGGDNITNINTSIHQPLSAPQKLTQQLS
ncbi:putative cytoplasmic protein [Salmonella enterica subsp. enterica serovar Baildon str. R6-199]|nr:putative cytoplasmic protein [Salmonella enterica subsp. enterica serovar Baildon str. R6-199]